MTNILGSITGVDVIFDELFSVDTMIMEYLGVEPSKLYGKSLITFSWLHRNFMHLDCIDDEDVSVDKNQVRIIFYVTENLLYNIQY